MAPHDGHAARAHNGGGGVPRAGDDGRHPVDFEFVHIDAHHGGAQGGDAAPGAVHADAEGGVEGGDGTQGQFLPWKPGAPVIVRESNIGGARRV